MTILEQGKLAMNTEVQNLSESQHDAKLDVSSRSVKAIKKCADWLKYCLDIGYHKDDLDTLEKIWWQGHDWKTGEVV